MTINAIINPQFATTEFPLVEVLLDDNIDDDKVALLKENCIEQLVALNIYTIIYKFANNEVLDKYLDSLSRIAIPELNEIVKINIEHLNEVNIKYFEQVASFSDIIIEIEPHQLSSNHLFKEINNCRFDLIIRVTYSCNPDTIKELWQLLDFLDQIKNIKSIVLNPDNGVDLDLKEYLATQRKVFGSKRQIKVFYDRGNFPASVLREHPCNAYVLSCENCHAGKKDIPRTFTIESDGLIYPEGLDSQFPQSVIGDIYKNKLNEILQTYWLTENHYFFKKACEKVYDHYVLDYPYGFMPWRYLFLKVTKEILIENLSKGS